MAKKAPTRAEVKPLRMRPIEHERSEPKVEPLLDAAQFDRTPKVTAIRTDRSSPEKLD